MLFRVHANLQAALLGGSAAAYAYYQAVTNPLHVCWDLGARIGRHIPPPHACAIYFMFLKLYILSFVAVYRDGDPLFMLQLIIS
jgi:hypothetical protein